MKRKQVLVLFTLSILFAFGFQYNLHAGENAKTAKIDELLKRYHDYGYLNGVVLVADNGNIIYKKAFGFANMELKVPLKIDTKFNIYSCSKQFTAAAVIRLVEEGKIKLQGKISDYLPGYPKEVGEKITIHQLLTHTHGIPDPDYNEMPLDISGPADEVLKARFSGTPTFAPGSRFRYSGLSGYTILGAIIEKVTGKPFNDVLTQNIFKPSNMKNTTHTDCKEILKGAASAYLRSDHYRAEKWNRWIYPTYAGASNIYSTVEDMYLWDRSLCTDKLLSKKNRDLLFTRHAEQSSGRPKYYGYGWYLDDPAMGGIARKLAVHSGGGSNIACRALDDNHLVVILTNLRNRKLFEMNFKLMQILYDDPAYVLPKRSLKETLFKTVKNEGIEAGVKKYRFLKENHANDYYFNKWELHDLGIQFYYMDKFKEALEIFKLNLEANPNHWNCYDCVGAAYKKLDEKALAIKNYKKALELNPQSNDWEKNGYKEGEKALKELERK